MTAQELMSLAERVQNAVVGLSVAAWVAKAREMIHDKVDCLECAGTGSDTPTCKTCKGYRSVRLKRLYALGWRKDELEDIDESDGYACCPDCGGDSCEFCEGEGQVARFEQAQQERRALIFARYQKLPPLCTLDYMGRRRREYQLLSWEAARPLYDGGKAMRLNSVFGHEFYLNRDADFPALWRAARARASSDAGGRG